MAYTGEFLKLNTDVGGNYNFGEYYIDRSKPDLVIGSFFVQYFKGLIDGVHVYNQALDAQSVYCLLFDCEE